MPLKTEDVYLFVTSARPDPYVNILVHITKRIKPNRIFFIGITEHNYGATGGEQQATAIASRTHTMLERLAEGKYESGPSPSVALPGGAAEEYRQCIERLKFVQISSRGIKWDDLAEHLKEFAKNGRSTFDVTTLKKNLLVDAVALLLASDESDIRTFELLKKPTFGVDDLIHALKEDRDYKYRSLAESKHVEKARKQMVARSLTYYSLMVITLAIFVPVILAQFLAPTSWLQGLIVAIGAATSIASWAFGIKRR